MKHYILYNNRYVLCKVMYELSLTWACVTWKHKREKTVLVSVKVYVSMLHFSKESTFI